MSRNKSAGKLIGLYSTSPMAMQRAAILAFVSFIFFIVMLLMFYIRPQLVYFLLSSTFLIVHIITLTGMWMQKNNSVRVFTEAVAYKKTTVFWENVISAEISADRALDLQYLEDGNEKTMTIPRSISNLDNLAAFILSKTVKAVQQ